MANSTATHIHDGYFTVTTSGGHRTFRVHTQDQDASFAPGKQVIAFLSGPCNEGDYTSFAFVANGQVYPWKRFQHGYDTIIAAARFLVGGDYQAAGKMFALESGLCYVCGRTLTDPLSIETGIGPICASRIGIERQSAEEVAAQAEKTNMQKMATQRIGTFYEDRAEQMRHDAERTAYLNYCLSLDI